MSDEVCKYGPTFPDSEGEVLPKEIIETLVEKNRCQCGNKMDKDANFCSNCGLPRENALLTYDEREVLNYIKQQKTVDIRKFEQSFPFFYVIAQRFFQAIDGLKEKQFIIINDHIVVEFKKPAP